MKTKAKYIIIFLFLLTIPLYFYGIVGNKEDGVRIYDVFRYEVDSEQSEQQIQIAGDFTQHSIIRFAKTLLVGSIGGTLIGGILIALLNGKKVYILAIFFSVITNGSVAWALRKISEIWKEIVDDNWQMTRFSLRIELVVIWIVLHLLIIAFSVWGMLETEKQKKTSSEIRPICSTCGRVPKSGEKFCPRCGRKL